MSSTRSPETQETEAQLSIKDRLNFPYLIANQILTFQKAILNLQFSEREIQESIEGFVHLIPGAWKDKQFEKDMKKAEKNSMVDLRPDFCGVKPSIEYCEANGIPVGKKKNSFDYYKVFQACMNLLNRRKMLSKVNPVEQMDFVELEHIADSEAIEIG